MREIKCEHCGLSFIPSRPQRRFCCKTCSSRATRIVLYADYTARFTALVERNGDSECWPFRGTILNTGYGQIKIGRQKVSAHRLAYEFAFGDIPHGICVCHTCDNPPCCNPSHLFLGTHKDNAIDRERKGRGGVKTKQRRDVGVWRIGKDKLSALRYAVSSGMTYEKAAQHAGVSTASVHRMKREMNNA